MEKRSRRSEVRGQNLQNIGNEIKVADCRGAVLEDLNTHIMNNNNVGAASSCPTFEETTQDINDIKIEEILNWKYKYKSSENIPTKTSVSKIKEQNQKITIETQIELRRRKRYFKRRSSK